MGRRKLLKFSYDFLVGSMSTLDKNKGGFQGGPYFGALPPNSYGTPPPLIRRGSILKSINSTVVEELPVSSNKLVTVTLAPGCKPCK